MTISQRVRNLETGNRAQLIPVSGDPNGALTAAEGVFAWDYTNNVLYVNTDGITNWQRLTGLPAAAAFSTSDTTTNLNVGAGGVVVPWNVGFSYNSPEFTLSSNQITVTHTAVYKVTTHITYTSTSPNVSVAAFLLLVSTSPTPLTGQGVSHVNAASGQDFATSTFSFITQIAAGDSVFVKTAQAGAAGTATMVLNDSLFMIERLS